MVIKLIPGYDDDALIALVEHCTALRAVVLELYGTGNSPSRREDFVKFIKVRACVPLCVYCLQPDRIRLFFSFLFNRVS